MINKKEKSIFADTIGLVVLSVILKAVGFVHKIVIAYYYGTTNLTDIYYSASGFIEGMAEILLAGLTVGIINIYVKKKDKNDKIRFVSNVLVSVIGILTFFGIIVFFLSKPFSSVLAPAYTDDLLDKLQETVKVLCITFPFIGITSVFSATLQAEKKFIPVKMTGTIASLVSIVLVIFLSRKIDYLALVLAFICASVLNAIFLRVNLKKEFRFSPCKPFKDKNINELLKLSLPLVIALAATQINIMVDRAVATTIGEGIVSCLIYCVVLYLFVENIIVNSTVVALFPNLVKQRHDGEDELVANTAINSLLLGLTLLVPISIAFFFFSEEIVNIVYMRGSFTHDSLIATSMALKGYMIGMPFLLLREVSIRVFYAYDNTKTPMVINLISVGLNIFLDIILAKCFGIIGVTLATSISIFLSSIIVTLLSKKHNLYYVKNFSIKKIVLLCGFVAVEILICYFIPAYNYTFIIIACACIFIIQLVSLRFIEPKAFNVIKQKLFRFKK